MTGKRHRYVPSMSDAAVKAKTGRDWAGWFGALDRAGAAKFSHPAIVGILAVRHGVPGWWCQMVTVEYERARGLRVRHQTASGYSVAISQTIATSLSALYAAATSNVKRAAWFPRGVFERSTQTPNKYLRGAWNKNARLEIGFYAKRPGKAQIAVQISRLAKKAEVERERQAWKAALGRLQEKLED